MRIIVFPPSACGRKVMTGALVISSPTLPANFSIAAASPLSPSEESDGNSSAPPFLPTVIFLTPNGAA